MSDSEAASRPLLNLSERSSKRRKVYDSEVSTPRYDRDTSPDELAEPSLERTIRTTQRLSDAARRRTSVDGVRGERSPSPDELDHTYYRNDDARSDGSSRRSISPRSVRSFRSSEEPISEPRTPSPPRQVKQVLYRQKFVLHGHQKGVSQVRFSPDGRWIASCSADATIKIWDASTGQHLHTLEGHLAGISTISWSPDSRYLASGSDDKAIRLWDRATGKPYPVPLLGHHNYVYSIAFSPKGNMLVSGSYDEALFLWDVRAGRQMRSLPAHSDPVGGVDFVRDGTLVVSCATDGLIRIWDTATGQCLRTIVHEDNAPVVSVQFSPNGKYVLAWTLDGCIRLWDYVEGLCKKTYQGHVNKKYSLGGAFGTYGRDAFVLSGSEDGNIVIWDVKTKDILQQVKAHDGPVLWADTHPTLDFIVTGGLDGTVKVWTNEDDEVKTRDPSVEVEKLSEKAEVMDYDTPMEHIPSASPEASAI